MLPNLTILLLESSPLLRRMLWRWWYGRLAKRFTTRDWTFMNYGFAPPDGAGPGLEPADEPDRYCIQLYHHVVSPVDLAGKRVLEVGSGRGGGASFLARYHRPTQVTGVDFSPQSVALSRQRHAGVPDLQFIVGDAENLAFPTAAFDVVVNVESSHCYGHIAQFFAEAVRVLRPGGHFLYTDFRDSADLASLETLLMAMPAWELVASEDITSYVSRALQADDERKRALIRQFIPAGLQHLFGEFAGLAGGRIHTAFCARTLLYHRFAFRKR